MKASMAKMADGSDLGKEVASLHERVSALEKDKLDLTTQLDQFKADASKSEGKSEEKDGGDGSGGNDAERVKELEAKVKELEDHVEEHEMHNLDSAAEHDELSKEKAGLVSKVAALEKERDEMKGTLDKALDGHELGEELKAANEKAAAATELQTKVDELAKQVEEHEGHNLDAAAEHDELAAKVEALSKERDDLKKQIDENAVMTETVRVTDEEVAYARSMIKSHRAMGHKATPTEISEAEDMVKRYESQGPPPAASTDIEGAKKEVATLTDANKGLAEQLAAKTTECDAAAAKMAELTAESRAHKQTEGKLKNQHNETLHNHEIANAANVIVIHQLRRKRGETEELLQMDKEEKEHLAAEVQKLQEKLAKALQNHDMGPELQASHDEVDELKTKLKTAVADKDGATKELEAAKVEATELAKSVAKDKGEKDEALKKALEGSDMGGELTKSLERIKELEAQLSSGVGGTADDKEKASKVDSMAQELDETKAQLSKALEGAGPLGKDLAKAKTQIEELKKSGTVADEKKAALLDGMTKERDEVQIGVMMTHYDSRLVNFTYTWGLSRHLRTILETYP